MHVVLDSRNRQAEGGDRLMEEIHFDDHGGVDVLEVYDGAPPEPRLDNVR
jgi:hypothetical protein